MRRSHARKHKAVSLLFMEKKMETQQHQEIRTAELGMNPKPTHVCPSGVVSTAVGFLRACGLFPLLVAVSGTGGREVSALRRLILLGLLLFLCMCVWTCMCVCECPWRKEGCRSRISFRGHPLWFVKQAFSLTWTLSSRLGWWALSLHSWQWDHKPTTHSASHSQMSRS